jgi:hypothetical protein
VRALTEETSRTIDEEVIRLAASEQRVLLTEDKDFGWLAFVTHEESHGVILIRYRGDARQALGEAIEDLVATDRPLGAIPRRCDAPAWIAPRRASASPISLSARVSVRLSRSSISPSSFSLTVS